MDLEKTVYRFTHVEGYSHPAHVFGLDYYEPGSQGSDEFSRKEAWFYFLGDEELKTEFGGRFRNLIDELFIKNSVDWDVLTLAPSEQEDELNENLREITEDAANELDIEYEQVLQRVRTVDGTGEMESTEQKITDIEDSIEVTGDVEGSNVIVVDNVSVSGITFTHLTEMLLQAGARRVGCVALGVTNHQRGVKKLERGVTASSAMSTATGGE